MKITYRSCKHPFNSNNQLYKHLRQGCTHAENPPRTPTTLPAKSTPFSQKSLEKRPQSPPSLPLSPTTPSSSSKSSVPQVQATPRNHQQHQGIRLQNLVLYTPKFVETSPQFPRTPSASPLPSYRSISPPPPAYPYLTVQDLYIRYAPLKFVKLVKSFTSTPIPTPTPNRTKILPTLTIQDLYKKFKKQKTPQSRHSYEPISLFQQESKRYQYTSKKLGKLANRKPRCPQRPPQWP